VIGHYRIYPAWFHGTGCASGNAQGPMNELAQREARRLNLAVAGIAIVVDDTDHRGHYLDFDVLYTSSGLERKSS
jgi:hypothetical protein